MTVLSLLNPVGWFGYRAKLSGGQNYSTPGERRSGRDGPVTVDRALQVSTYWACVRLIAQTIGTLPLQLFERQGSAGRVAMTDDPLYALLHDRPNADHTAVEFWEGVGAALAVWGNAYALKQTIGTRVVALDLLRSNLMVVLRTLQGGLVYRYFDPFTGPVDFDESQILHIRGFGFGDIVGLSPLSFARQTLHGAVAANDAADATFENGLRVSGWFKYKGGNGILTREQREKAKAALIEPYVGVENAAKVGLLEGDFDWISGNIPPVDGQLLESRQFSVEEICRWFGIPPVMIGHAAAGQTMWGSGVEQIILAWMTTGLRPYLVRIEQAINRGLVPPAKRATVYVEHNIDALLRADSKSRAANYSTMAQNGIYTRNEIREMENLPAVEGGDSLTVQSNLIPIDKLGLISTLPRMHPDDPGAAVQPDGPPVPNQEVP